MQSNSTFNIFLCILFLVISSLPGIAQYSTLNTNPLLGDYDIKFYKLDIEADDKSDQFQGNVAIFARVQNNPLSTLVGELCNSLGIRCLNL